MQSFVTFRGCDFDHASLVLNVWTDTLVDTLDRLPGSDCLYLRMNPDELDKYRLIFSDDRFYGKRVGQNYYPCRDKLKPIWKSFINNGHVTYLLHQLDIIARLMNRRAVRSRVSLIVSNSGDGNPSPQMWHVDKTPESARNETLQHEYGHCFSFLVSLGPDCQSLNYLTGATKEAFQLQLPPGIVVALGPEQIHAGSSDRGARLHICYDVRGVDSFEDSENHWWTEEEWPDWRSDGKFTKVDWKLHALSVPIVTQ